MSFIAEMNTRYFDGGLSSAALQLLAPLERERAEVQAFTRRAFDQLHRQHVGAEDFPDLMAWSLGSLVGLVLPGAWGGIVPPITVPGRQAILDEYLTKNPWRSIGDGDHLLDLGCGFPPVTTIDAAARFPNCRITGADPSFAKYLVREANGNYAAFDESGTLLYFQSGSSNAVAWRGMFDDPAATRRRFTDHLENLRGSLPTDDGSLARVECDGLALTRDPVMEYNRDNVTFRQIGIGSEGLSGYQIVRCLNVLFYFDDAFREKALDWLSGVVSDGGLFLCGVTAPGAGCARYAVYQADGGRIVPREFAFSIGNIRPLELISLFTLQEDDRDAHLMARLIGILRSDEAFRRDFDQRLDKLLVEAGFEPRTAEGYLGRYTRTVDPQAFAAALETISKGLERDGFTEWAAEVLSRNGYRSWVNCVGHIAVEPNGL